MTLSRDNGGMVNAHRPDEFPTTRLEDFPRTVRLALARQARAANALRVYRRRGWNQQAARAEFERAKVAVSVALDEMERDEQNPRLF